MLFMSTLLPAAAAAAHDRRRSRPPSFTPASLREFLPRRVSALADDGAVEQNQRQAPLPYFANAAFTVSLAA